MKLANVIGRTAMTPRKRTEREELPVHSALRPYKEDYFRSTANDPTYWFKSAESLWAAAELIWVKVRDAHALLPSIEAFRDGTYAQGDNLRKLEESDRLHRRFVGPALLLSGYALENVLKAIKVKHAARTGCAPPVATGATTLDRTFKTHDLSALADDIGFPLGQHDSDLLRRLTTFILWAGRYPVDSCVDYPRRGPDAGTSSTDADDVASLFSRLCDFFNQQ